MSEKNLWAACNICHEVIQAQVKKWVTWPWSLEAGCTCGGMAACQQCQDRDAAALAEALTERDAEHEGGGS